MNIINLYVKKVKKIKEQDKKGNSESFSYVMESEEGIRVTLNSPTEYDDITTKSKIELTIREFQATLENTPKIK